MKAIQMREPGAPDVLTLVELPEPEIRSATEVLVRLEAAGVNPVDTKIRARGTLVPETLTAVLGCDGAGVVEAVGEGVTRFQPGDAVWFCHGGLGGHMVIMLTISLSTNVWRSPSPARWISFRPLPLPWY